MDNDIIETIPKSLERFLGKGKMVKPSAASVKKIVTKIKKGHLANLDIIRKQLAKEFKVETACPKLTMKAVQKLAEKDDISFWRIVKKKGELIEKFPGGLDRQAELLREEGFEIDTSKKIPAVVNYEDKFVKF